MLNKNILTDFELSQIEKELTHYEHPRAVLIEALKIVQKTRGWVSDNLIKEISRVLSISVVEVEEIATFYSQIYRCPVGRNIIKYCDSVVCYVMGYKNIKRKIQKILNIKPGHTTNDNKFTLLPISCLGNCDKAPVIMINNHTYSNVNIDFIPILLEKFQ
ncbi:NADH-quinone oxidoreductase subunit NuoE [Buchnera aphidicola]|uniref:NADH-quinone oxidoreductase subunit NuoE n=1 Tax=Buchnera aphidicola TaxID=9 RepID=UPI003463E231